MNLPPLSSSYSAYGSSNAAGGPTGDGKTRSRPGELSADDQQVVAELQARDREVRQHEQAHLAAAGGLAMSAARFSYERGPDGQNYAVGGEVSIDVSPGRTPQETIAKAEQIRAAALAPAQPSGQDRAVAAQAASMAQQAQVEQSLASNGKGPSGAVDRSNAVDRAYSAISSANNQGSRLQAWA